MDMPLPLKRNRDDTLPLSWCREDLLNARFVVRRLRLSRRDWICLAEIPRDDSFDDVIKNLRTQYKKGFIIRGCSAGMAGRLHHAGFQVLQIGLEAELDLANNPFKERKLRQQVQRGFRNTIAEELKIDQQSLGALNELQKNSTHGSKPQLRFLFRRTVTHERLFVLRCKENPTWFAALTISTSSKSKAHAELLLRRKDAPPGAMEALISHIYHRLKREGLRYWSLGEVPFVGLPGSNGLKSTLVKFCGKSTAFAYNSPGLFRFKNKYRPHWKAVFLCGHPSLSLPACAEIAWRSGFIKLIAYSSMVLVLRNAGIKRRNNQ